MFVQVSEWYYHGSGRGYQTKSLAVNVDEISDIRENYDPYHNTDGTIIVLKNGRQYVVKEKYKDVMELILK